MIFLWIGLVMLALIGVYTTTILWAVMNLMDGQDFDE